MGAGSRAIYLKNYLLSAGIPVNGETVKDVVANYDVIRAKVKVEPHVDAKVDLYRKMGGDRRPAEKVEATLVGVVDAEGLRSYLLARHDFDAGNLEFHEDLMALSEEISSRYGWRDRSEILKAIDGIAEKALRRFVDIEEKPEFEAPPLLHFPPESDDPRPYLTRNYNFTFRRAFWAGSHPGRDLSFSGDDFVMQEYGHVTFQQGKSVFMGVPSHGDAVIALLNPQTKIATAAIFPLMDDLSEAIDSVRSQERKIVLGGLKAAGKGRVNAVRDAIEELETIDSPYEYEFKRMLAEHAATIPDGGSPELEAVFLIAKAPGRELPEVAAEIAGAALMMGIEVKEVASISAGTQKNPAGAVVFHSAIGQVKVGGRKVAAFEEGEQSISKGFDGNLTLSTAEAVEEEEELSGMEDGSEIPSERGGRFRGRSRALHKGVGVTALPSTIVQPVK